MMESKYWQLHARPHEPHQWWACEQPERPPDNDMDMDLFCLGCFAAAETLIAHDQGRLTLQFSPEHPEGEVKRFADTVARHVELHGRPTPVERPTWPPPPDAPPEKVTRWERANWHPGAQR